MDRVFGLLTAPGLPVWAALSAVVPRWRTQGQERFGLAVAPVAPGVIWLHAASVGETVGAVAIAVRLPPPVLLTVDTPEGVAHGLALVGNAQGITVARKPVDHPWTLAPLWSEARPRLLVFVEGSFWPALAWRARRAQVPVLRVAVRTGKRTRRFGPLLVPWWHPVDEVLARDAEAAAFLSRVHRCPVSVVGDPKGDAAPAGPSPVRFAGPFAVGACLRQGDARRFIAAMDAIHPDMTLLIAPRHPDTFDFDELAGRPVLLRSQMRTPEVPPGVRMVLLDTVGELSRCYVGASLAFVGGTFDPAIGGHAPFEAAAAGVPVVAGPRVGSHAAAFAAVGACVAVDGNLARAIGLAKAPVAVHGGAADRIARRLVALRGLPAPEAAPRPWATPLVPLVAVVDGVREALHRRGLRPLVRLAIPVVGIGSANARSPGRTSTALAVVEALVALGYTVGVSVHGAGRPGWRRDVVLGTTFADLGDEGMLFHRRGARVAAGRDRATAARLLAAAGCTVVVLDDGARQRALVRDLEIAVHDARFPGARGRLPAGDRRSHTATATIHVVHHTQDGFCAWGLPVVRALGPWRRGDGVAQAPVGPVAAFAGIGRPADFLSSLEVAVDRFWALPDHGSVDEAALVEWSADLPLVCTEKDVVRLTPALGNRVFYRPLCVELPPSLLAQLVAMG